MITVKIRKIRFFVSAFIIVLLQQCFVHRLQWGCFNVDLIAVLAAYLIIYSDAKHAVISILILGLLRDMGSLGGLGLSMVSFLVSAIFLLLIKEILNKNNLISDLIQSYAFIMISGVLYNLFAGHGTWSFLYHGFCTAIASLIFVPPLFLFFRSFGVVKVIKTTF